MALDERQQWRKDTINRCIDNGMMGLDIASTVHFAECLVFGNALIVPFDDDEQKQELIRAIGTVLPNFTEVARVQKAISSA